MTVLPNQCCWWLLLLWLNFHFCLGTSSLQYELSYCAKEVFLTILVAQVYFGILQIYRNVESSVIWGCQIWYLLQYFTTSLLNAYMMVCLVLYIILVLETVYHLTEITELVFLDESFHWLVSVCDDHCPLSDILLLPCLRSQKMVNTV